MNRTRRSCKPGAIALLALLIASGCGVKSALIPPQEARPERIVDLKGAAAAGGIRLSWSRPTHYTAGGRMRDLDQFVILRAEPGQQLSPLIKIPLTDQERFRQQRRLSYLDADAQLGRSYRYEVIALTADGYQSAPSNQVELVRTPPPPPNPDKFALPAPAP